MEYASSELSGETLVVVALTGLLCLVIGLLLGRMGRGKLQEERARLSQQIGRTETQAKENARSAAQFRGELETVGGVFLSLPMIVQDLNRGDLDPREVPDVILRMAQVIFAPRQILLYIARRASGATDGRELHLVAHKGITEVPPELRVIPFGKGRIGFAASQEVDMLPDDWAKMVHTHGTTQPENHRSFKTDIVGPLVHHASASDEERVRGVLAICGPTLKRDEKLMFQMVTNLGTLALVNSHMVNRLRTMAHHDGLTQLLNKRYFKEDAAPKALFDCEKAAKPFSVFIFDIDKFKNYNDTNGHPAGDDLLRRMSDLIRRNLAPGHLVCRYGGEEFVIAMPETDRDTALALAEKLRQTIESTKFPHGEKQPGGRVTISGGIASAPQDGQDINELIQHADEVLYESKKGGRNRVALYRGVQMGAPGDEPYPIEIAESALSLER